MVRRAFFSILGIGCGLLVSVNCQAAGRRSVAKRVPSVTRTLEGHVEDAGEQSIAEDQPSDGGEVIRERYTNGRVKIERTVTQDAEGNYVNHGKWTEWDDKGNKLATGQYHYGKQNGAWTRWYTKSEGQLFAGPLFKAFQPPMHSIVTLQDGEIHGTWTVFDARRMKACEWEFDHGVRHGKSTWFYPNGTTAQEVDYRHGFIDGKRTAWSMKGKLLGDESYIEGRKHTVRTLWHSPGKKKAEGWVLAAPEDSPASFDWWSGSAAKNHSAKKLADEKHGPWTWWYANGQRLAEGRYLNDAPVGKWTYWHANGQKKMEGEYENGVQNGKWVSWNQNGTVLRVEEFDGNGQLAQTSGEEPTEATEGAEGEGEGAAADGEPEPLQLSEPEVRGLKPR